MWLGSQGFRSRRRDFFIRGTRYSILPAISLSRMIFRAWAVAVVDDDIEEQGKVVAILENDIMAGSQVPGSDH